MQAIPAQPGTVANFNHAANGRTTSRRYPVIAWEPQGHGEWLPVVLDGERALVLSAFRKAHPELARMEIDWTAA